MANVAGQKQYISSLQQDKNFARVVKRIKSSNEFQETTQIYFAEFLYGFILNHSLRPNQQFFAPKYRRKTRRYNLSNPEKLTININGGRCIKASPPFTSTSGMDYSIRTLKVGLFTKRPISNEFLSFSAKKVLEITLILGEQCPQLMDVRENE